MNNIELNEHYEETLMQLKLFKSNWEAEQRENKKLREVADTEQHENKKLK
jgi:hypothetical protein